jgi:predicted deacetylase
MPADSPRLLCISLHDVAPATLDDCANTLAFLDDLRLGPVALLVVPDYHGLGRVDRDHGFTAFIDSRILRGDEIVLHGFRHADTAPPGTGMRDWLERRVYTDSEGEFSRLNFDAARTRILRGLSVLRSAGWHPNGFVAPAWLISEGTREALDGLPLQYYSTRDAVVLMESDRKISAPSLVVSTRAAWRRAASHIWTQTILRCHSRQPIIRVALHPRDLRYPAIERLWRTLLSQLDERRVVTECQLVPRRPWRHADRAAVGLNTRSATDAAPTLVRPASRQA